MIKSSNFLFAVFITFAIVSCKKQHDDIRTQFPIQLKLAEVNVKQPIRMYIGNREIVDTTIITNFVRRTLIFKNLQTEASSRKKSGLCFPR
jgi:hypothetical protein